MNVLPLAWHGTKDRKSSSHRVIPSPISGHVGMLWRKYFLLGAVIAVITSPVAEVLEPDPPQLADTVCIYQ